MSLQKILGVALCATIFMTGCATIADPITYSEQKSPGRSVAKNVLVVIDVSLMAGSIGTGSAQKQEESLKGMFLPLANAMVDEVKKSDADASHVIHFSGMRLPPPGPEYSHVWTQVMEQMTQKGGFFISNYVWAGTIAERREQAGFTEIYRVKYQSDGSKCFISALYFANKVECQKNYLDRVSGQWARAGLKP